MVVKAILPPESALRPPLRIPPAMGLVIGEGGREEFGVDKGDVGRDMESGEGDFDLGDEAPEVEAMIVYVKEDAMMV